MADMIETPGPIDQAISQSRLSLKPPYLKFLGDPSVIDITYGPMGSFLLHHPERRRAFIRKILPPPGTPLDTISQDYVERLLVSGMRQAPVDDHGRIRIEKVHLAAAGLEASSQAYLMPREAYGWIEVWNEDGYFGALRKPDDEWLQALSTVVQGLH